MTENILLFVMQSNTMETNIPKKTTKGPKKTTKVCWPVPANVVAQVVGCSTSMVRAVRREERNISTDLATKICIADDLLKKGAIQLTKDIQRLI